MWALVTGASSGIGREFAIQLSERGYDIIAVARREERLFELSEIISSRNSVRVLPMVCDLSDREQCRKLCESILEKNLDIEIIISNAGFGRLGFFTDIPLSDELSMTDVNCCAVDIIMKYFLRHFNEKNRGYILNVSSVGAFPPGPLLANYYATKAYVKSLTVAVSEEQRALKKNVYVGCLCPGPVDTEFSDVANAKHSLRSMSAESVVRYAIKGMMKKQTVIIPGTAAKLSAFFSKLLPDTLIAKISCKIQKKKL